jgi:catechol 2,3-dioxygenase-like lactoylglutathione lyase family enzyme
VSGATRPRLAIDHVQVAVADLEAAARRYERDLGLTALPGGRHPGRGTANMIVPLGDSYLELISVVDVEEARRHPTAMRVAGAVESGRSFAVWVARTDDLDAARAWLGQAGYDLPPVAVGARRRPDGSELSWRMQELAPGGAFSPLPFLIEWRVPADQHPGAAPARHRAGALGIAGVALTDPDPEHAEARLRALLDDQIRWSLSPGEPGVTSVTLATSGGPLVLR